MPDIADRLKAAREGLGLSQQAIAEHCGVTSRSQRNYETGERQPDALYLARLVELGVDVIYVLTGESMGGQPATDASEQLLLENYRRCALPAKQNLLQNSVLLAAGIGAAQTPATSKSKTAATSPGMHMSNVGDGNVQVGSVSGGLNVSAPRKRATAKPKEK